MAEAHDQQSEEVSDSHNTCQSQSAEFSLSNISLKDTSRGVTRFNVKFFNRPDEEMAAVKLKQEQLRDTHNKPEEQLQERHNKEESADPSEVKKDNDDEELDGQQEWNSRSVEEVQNSNASEEDDDSALEANDASGPDSRSDELDNSNALDDKEGFVDNDGQLCNAHCQDDNAVDFVDAVEEIDADVAADAKFALQRARTDAAALERAADMPVERQEEPEDFA